jgi:hypothetical protein
VKNAGVREKYVVELRMQMNRSVCPDMNRGRAKGKLSLEHTDRFIYSHTM